MNLYTRGVILFLSSWFGFLLKFVIIWLYYIDNVFLNTGVLLQTLALDLDAMWGTSCASKIIDLIDIVVDQ